MYSVLALDPGRKNFAWAYATSDLQTQTGMLTIATGNPDEIVTHFRPQVTSLLEVFTPDKVVIERFMTRQHGSLNNEIINILIGVVLSVCHVYGIPASTITSSVWKSKFRRDVGLSSDDVKWKGKSDHECDAIGMTAYTMNSPILWSLMAVSACLTNIDRVHRTRKQWTVAKEITWNTSHVASLIEKAVGRR